jgi:photosystem II stability/assembly factor-like uncharacterized protein
MGTDKGVFKTTDGGQTWIEQPIPGKDVRVTSIHFLNEREGWATGVDFNADEPNKNGFGFKSMLLHTTDAGAVWRIATRVNGDEWYHKVHFSDENKGWLYTDTALYRTIDGGSLWNAVLEYARPSYKID